MNRATIDRMKKHAAEGGKSLTVVPGDGYYSLTWKTSCTYLHDNEGLVSAVLLETAAGEGVDEAAQFLCQQVVLAASPSSRLSEMGIVGLRGKKLAIVTAFDGVPAGDMNHIHERLLRLSARTIDMGHVSEWPASVVEAMIK
jgi:hypothetical protein